MTASKHAPNALAIQALQAQIQKIAVDANLWDKGLATYPWAETCSTRRRLLLAEIERLKHPQLVMAGVLK